jgi:hypothetical protein
MYNFKKLHVYNSDNFKGLIHKLTPIFRLVYEQVISTLIYFLHALFYVEFLRFSVVYLPKKKSSVLEVLKPFRFAYDLSFNRKKIID